MTDIVPKFSELEVESFAYESIPWHDRNSNQIRVLTSSLIKLSDKQGKEAVFRLRRDTVTHRITLTLCYSTFGGGTPLMEGKRISFIEGAGLTYYHLVSLSCDPRGERKKVMVKHEIDMPKELLDNLDLERHEVVYGKKTSKKNGLCVLVDKDDIEIMSKVFFYEKLVPIMNLRIKDSKRSKNKIPKEQMPQANRLDIVLKLLCENDVWPLSSTGIADFLLYKPRQGLYYARAAELLKLLRRVDDGWEPTDRGRNICSMDEQMKWHLLSECAAQLPIVSVASRLVESQGTKGISLDGIIKELKAYSDLDGSTHRRRVECVMSWLLQLGFVAKTGPKETRYICPTHNSLCAKY